MTGFLPDFDIEIRDFIERMGLAWWPRPHGGFINLQQRVSPFPYRVKLVVDHFGFTRDRRCNLDYARSHSAIVRRAGQPWSIAYGSFVPFTTIPKYPTEGIKPFPRDRRFPHAAKAKEKQVALPAPLQHHWMFRASS